VHSTTRPFLRAVELIAFAVTWRSWDGSAEEDIGVEFGLSPEQYFRRLRAALDDPAGVILPVAGVEQLRDSCDYRLREFGPFERHPHPALRSSSVTDSHDQEETP
jgi:hypothetical protein